MAAPRRYAALLRGVNVGGRALVAMADLRAVFGDLGCTEVRTVLQSGNVVFRAATRARDRLERDIGAALHEQLACGAEVFVRTEDEVRAIVAQAPFAREAQDDPSHVLAMLLRTRVATARVAALREAITGRERIEIRGDTLYLVYPDGIGRSRLTNALIEKALQTTGTARNWNTLQKLLAP